MTMKVRMGKLLSFSELALSLRGSARDSGLRAAFAFPVRAGERVVSTFAAPPGAFFHQWELPAGALSGPGAWVPLAVTALVVGGFMIANTFGLVMNGYALFNGTSRLHLRVQAQWRRQRTRTGGEERNERSAVDHGGDYRCAGCVASE